MGKLRKISQKKIKRIAAEYGFDEEILHEIIDDLEVYANVLHDSLHEFAKHPDSKYDEFAWKIDPKDRAKVSLFYHDNKEKIEQKENHIFERVVFLKTGTKKEPLELSQFLANDIFATYIEKLVDMDSIIDRETAEVLLANLKKAGRREDDFTSMQNNMLKIAAGKLKNNGVRNYAKVLESIFHHLHPNFKGLSNKTIRVIVHRP